jgi:beta-galactosidase GanA
VLHQIRSDGYNAVAIDLFWGYHAPRPGAYDFSGIRDLDKLFDDAAREHLYVAVDSGPYSENGADAGGIPDFLLAHTAADATLDDRYRRESRQWLKRIDPIIARHQFTDGRGTIVLDEVDPGALGTVAGFQRDARRDGVSVPFGTVSAQRAYDGFPWGWTTAPAHYQAGAAANGASAITPSGQVLWRMRRDDRETELGFEDQAWPPVLAARQFDPDADDDDGPKSAPNDRSTNKRFFGVDDYGFHHGVVWYRGHFTASGLERTFTLSGTSGRGGAAGIWLNGQYLGSALADAAGGVAAHLRVPPGDLRPGRDNLLSVLFENAGHDADPRRDSPDAPARGMFAASLDPATAIDWHILGNGEYNVDALRGPVADGGLAGEIAGWQYPSFSDADWTSVRQPFESRPGVVWYRAAVPFDSRREDDRVIALQLDFAGNANYRAFVYCNGWLMGHVVARGGERRTVPLAPGILDNPGTNTLAVALWTIDGHGELGVSYANAEMPSRLPT